MPLGLGPFLDQIVTLLLLVAAAIGGINLYKKTVNPPSPVRVQASSSTAKTVPTHSAEEILRERYARGEINHTQFQEMIGDLIIGRTDNVEFLTCAYKLATCEECSLKSLFRLNQGHHLTARRANILAGATGLESATSCVIRQVRPNLQESRIASVRPPLWSPRLSETPVGRR